MNGDVRVSHPLPRSILIFGICRIPAFSVIGSITPHCSHQLLVLNRMRHPQLAAQLVSCQHGVEASAAAGSQQEAGAFAMLLVGEAGYRGECVVEMGGWLWVLMSLQFSIDLVKQASKAWLEWIPWTLRSACQAGSLAPAPKTSIRDVPGEEACWTGQGVGILGKVHGL